MKRRACAAVFALAMSMGFAQKLVIYSEPAPPFQVPPSGDAPATGFAVEIVRALQREVGTNEPIQFVEWARGFYEAQHTPNVMLFTAARTEEREKLFRWLGPFFTVEYLLVAKKHRFRSTLTTEQAKGLKIIGTVKGDARDQILRDAGFSNLEQATTAALNIRKLQAGRIDAYATSNVAWKEQIRKEGFNPEEYEAVYPIRVIPVYCVFSPATDPEIFAAWERAFKTIAANGTLKRLSKQWFPDLD